MIEHKVGDLVLECPEGFIMHGCNAQGVMGSGIAKQIRDKEPIVFEAYETKFQKGYRHILPGHTVGSHMPELKMGTVIPVAIDEMTVYLNAVTQRVYYGHKEAQPGQTRFTDYEAVAQALEYINTVCRLDFPDIQPTLHFPLIGCYRGGADWNIVSSMIDHIVTDMDKVLWTLK